MTCRNATNQANIQSLLPKRFILHKGDKREAIVRNNAMQFIDSGVFNHNVEIIIRRYVKSHSDEQRGGFHFLCKSLGDRLGYRLNEIKELVKKETYGVREITIGNKVYEVTESSEVNEDGEIRDKIDYGKLIEGIYRLADDAGEPLPVLDPDHWKKK